MRTNQTIIPLLLLISGLSIQTAHAVERLFWDKVPLRITLPIGKERLVTFPADVRVGIPGFLAMKLRTQSNQGTVYWKASEAFDTQRIEVRETQSQRIYLIDLKATKQARSTTPVEVIFKQTGQVQSTQQSGKTAAKPVKKMGYVALTRFAAQQLYAPARLLNPSAAIHRVSIVKQPTTHLIRGEQIRAIPVASWQSGSMYVTAVELKNTSQHYITLDPRHIRGKWRTATFHHSRLHPMGSESDTTAVYLISNRPYHEAI